MKIESIFAWLKQYAKEVLIIAVCLLCVGIFISAFLLREKANEAPVVDLSEQIESQLSSENSEGNEETSSESIIIFVDVKGEVAHPGVYELRKGERIQDAIAAAGGFSQQAETKWINLAQIVEDQMLLYIPAIGEEAFETPSNDMAVQNTDDSLVNINTGDIQTLMTLNGIGQKKAEAIIAYREENGSFQTIEALMEVSGIGEKTFESLKDDLTVKD